MLLKRGRNVFLFVVVVLFCFVPSRIKGIGSSDNIFYDALLRPILKGTVGHVKMNYNKHGFFHQYDFSTFSFSVPLFYRLVSVDNVVSFIEGLVHWRGHEENLKLFFTGDSTKEYGSFFDEKMKYKFLEKYKNLTYSSSKSNCITFLYSWYMQLKKSNFFASYGLLYEYSKHIYSFDYYTFKYAKEIFENMEMAYDYILVYGFISSADKIIHTKYPELLQIDNSIPQDNIKPNLDSRYDSIVKDYAKKYINDEKCRQGIKTLSDLYLKLNNNERKTLENDLKCKYLDYNSRDNWEAANKSVAFCVNDFGVHVGISYLQNKIDPFYGFYFSLSFAAGVQYITCVDGFKIQRKEYNNNWFAFLCNRSFYKNLFSFFIKFKLEAGYGLLRFFISFKSLDLQEIKKALGNEMEFKLGEGKSAVRLEEYNEACYNSKNNLFAKFKIKDEEGLKRFLPKIIQFGFTLNL